MTKHTPGPWNRYDNGGESGLMTYGIGYADCVWGPRGPGHGLVADCSPHGQPATPETTANARLIAAAPELLEACAAWIVYDERPVDGPNAGVQMMVDYDRALTLARAAIAKATGK